MRICRSDLSQYADNFTEILTQYIIDGMLLAYKIVGILKYYKHRINNKIFQLLSLIS